MSIVANTLFHFTRTEENLISILQNNFYPRYCIEDYSFLLPQYKNTPLSKIGIPMVCFCDIPLTQMDEHIEDYGEYAIGLKKEWAEKNKINPIFYLQEDSIPCEVFNNFQRQIFPALALENIFELYQDFVAYFKPYRNPSQKKAFYNEREWRWIPKISLEDKNQGVILRLMGIDLSRKDEYNSILQTRYTLEFTIDDINYIIVKERNEKLRLAKRLKDIKSKYSQDQILELITKIVSLEEIHNDF